VSPPNDGPRGTSSFSRGTGSHSREEAAPEQEGAQFTHKGKPDLEGPWSVDALTQILKKLEGARTVAYFLVSDGLSEKCIFFPAGGLRVTSIGARRGRALVDAIRAQPGYESKWEPAMAAAVSDQGKRGSLETLDDGPLRDAMKVASREVVRDELLDLLCWNGARFEFRLTNPPPAIFAPDLEAVKLSLGVRKLLEEVGEATKTWRRLAAKLGDPSKTMLTLRGKPPARTPGLRGAYSYLSRSEGRRAVLDEVLVAGRRAGALDPLAMAQELLDEAGKDALLLEVTPRPLSPEYRMERAKRRTGDLEAALAKLIDKLAAHRRLAEEYGELGEQEKAIQNWRVVGEELREREDYEGAVEVYKNVLDVSPMAFFAREELAGLFKKLKRGPEAVGQLLRLARDLARFKLFNRAQDPLRQAVQAQPDDPDLRRFLIDSLEANGDQDLADEEWNKLAQLYDGLGKMEEALACYQQVYERNPNHEKAKAALYAAGKPKTPVFGLLVLGIAMFLLFAGSGFVYLRFKTLSAFQAAREDALASAHLGQYEDARQVLVDFRALHDYSIERIDSVISVIDELESAEAAQALERGRSHEQEGRKLRALEQYEAIAKGYPKTKAAEEAKGLAGRIEAEVESAEASARKVETLIEDEKYAEAFKSGQALLKTHGWAPAVAALELPVQVDTRPSGATVRVDGKAVPGQTPLVLRRSWKEPFEVTVSLQGHEDASRKLHLQLPEAKSALTLVLPRHVRWSRTTGGPILAPPAVQGAKILTVSSDQTLYAYERSGRLVWRYPQGQSQDRLQILSGVRDAPLATPRAVFVVERRALRILSFTKGTLVKTVELPDRARAVGIQGDYAVVASPREVAAYDATGARIWRVGLPGVLVEASLDATKGRVLATTRSSQLCVIDAKAGKLFKPFQLESRPLTGPQGATGGAVYAREGKVLQLSWSKSLWTAELPGEATRELLVAKGRVFVACGKKLAAYSLEKGERLWAKVFTSPLGAPRYGEGNVYVATEEGQLWALESASGDVHWEFPARAKVWAAPAPNEDLIFLGGGDSKLYAIPN
jgi:outer membrane protein assembly factor BamB